jgi:hypothetical protein
VKITASGRIAFKGSSASGHASALTTW